MTTPTTSFFVTTSTQACELVPKDDKRRVIRILPPAAPQMRFAIDEDWAEIAWSRAYKWPPMPTGYWFDVPLEPGQFISVVADTAGQAPISVICIYRD